MLIIQSVYTSLTQGFQKSQHNILTVALLPCTGPALKTRILTLLNQDEFFLFFLSFMILYIQNQGLGSLE